MEDIKNVTVTYIDASGNQSIVRGLLRLEELGTATNLVLRYQESFSESVTKKAGVMVDVIAEDPGTAVMGGLTAIGIGVLKSAASALTGANYSHTRLPNDYLKDMGKSYDKKMSDLGPTKALWRTALSSFSKVQHPGNEIVLFNLKKGGSFTLTFSRTSVAKKFFNEIAEYLKGNGYGFE